MSRTHRFLLMVVASLLAMSVQSASALSTTTGPRGESISVSKRTALKPSGEVVTIKGNKFDETIGIYVAFCVLPKKGQVPTPCGGGADESGLTGASKWISSNPPPYGQGLAIPFKPGGRFSVNLKVAAKIGDLDCRKVRCAIAIRADHTRSDDRSHDIFVPLTFRK